MPTNTVLAIGAHPDDVELLCAGTLALLHAQGWQVEIASMTPGDCGSATLAREEISAIRRKEAAASAAVVDGSYRCLECDDIFIMYDRPTLLKIIDLVRQVNPAMVFAMSPEDYMVDHEVTSALTRTACFSAGMNNIRTQTRATLQPIPHLYYMDPMEGKDNFGRPVRPGIIVDITSTVGTKERMFLCHDSQRTWLKSHHHVDEATASMRSLAAMRGRMAGVRFGEGFRQHLGHAFPQDDLLETKLRGLVHHPPGEPPA